MPESEELLYEPKTPIVKPTDNRSEKDLNEILFGDEELSAHDDGDDDVDVDIEGDDND